ncbi:MAG TPA: HEAT repeat domain-containing protein [Planctomycetota bacterium]
MKTTVWNVVAWIGLGLAPLVAGATQAAGERQPPQELGLEPAGGATFAWHGPPQDGTKLLQELAALRVALDVDGDLAEALRALDALSLRAAAAQAFEGQAEALVQAALTRADVLERMGDLRRALAELQTVLPTSFRANGSLEFVAATRSLLAALETARADARIAARRAELERRQGAPDGGPESLDELVDGLFDEESYDEIVAIGFAAFERFAARVLETASEFRSDLSDEPLLYLVTLDERRSARFLAQNLTAGGPFWRQRILRVMQERNVLENDGTWTRYPYTCLEPEWLELVEQLLGARETAGTALAFFAQVERRNALTPSLNAAFVRALGTLGPDFATLAMQAFDHAGVVPSAQPALEAALALSDARLRRFAAQKLVNLPRSEALLARARDEDVEVRRCVVQSLGSRTLQEYVNESTPPNRTNVGARLSERDAPTLRTLLADEDAGIRAAAVALLDALEQPLAEDEYARLCADPSLEVRSQLAAVTSVPPETRGRMLALLARDPAQQVVQTLDNVLENDFGASGPISSNLGPYLEALGARWKDTQRPLDAKLRDRIRHKLVWSDEGTRALVTWALSPPDPEALKALDAAGKLESFLALPDELLARLLAASTSPESFVPTWDALHREGSTRPAAMRLVLGDASAPRRLRLKAARLGVENRPAYLQALHALLRDPSWGARGPDENERMELRRCGAALPPDEGNALALAVLADAAVTDEVADPFVAGYRPEAQGGTELAEAILARWLRPGAPTREAVSATLYRLGRIPGLARPERLASALEAYPEEVVEGIGLLADPQYLPLLARAMRAEWLPYDKRDDLQKVVAHALAGFDDDQAVELLLEGLRSSDGQVRKACFESLDRIKSYRAHVQIWQGPTRPTPTKASALGELLAMLGDADPQLRKEAARGLGALGATEALPDLIRALKDADAGVRAAAQASIERLNAPANEREKDPQPAGD